MKELRKEPRIKVSFPVECNVLPKNHYFYTVSKDLSFGGVQVLLDHFIPKGTFLKIYLNFIDKVIYFKSEVKWCNSERTIARFRAGLKILEINKQNQEVLDSFLNKQIQTANQEKEVVYE